MKKGTKLKPKTVMTRMYKHTSDRLNKISKSKKKYRTELLEEYVPQVDLTI